MRYLFLLFLLIDQITKAAFANRDFFLFGLHLHPVKNYGLPFGLNFDQPWNIILLFVVYVVAGAFVFRMKSQTRWLEIGKALFIAGASSNMADRLTFGYVRDFIDIRLGFVFNLADLFIVLGLIILLMPGEKSASTAHKVENL